jgi:hypothetical protein
MKKLPLNDDTSYQFIVLPYTGLQICRGFPLSKSVKRDSTKLWNIGLKNAEKFANDETIRILSEHLAINRNLNATGWIPCSVGENVFFRLTRAHSEEVLLDLLIDTRHGAGKQFKNKIPCILEEGFSLFKKQHTLATFYVTEHREASGVRGNLLIDYGNSAISALFSPTGKGPFKDAVIAINEPLDPDYKTRSVDEQRLLPANLCFLKISNNPDFEPWVVTGRRAAELIKLEPICTYLFAPKKYIRYWPERLKSLEPSSYYRGVIGQRDGLFPMLEFVRLGIYQLIESIISSIVNPKCASHAPEMYPIIERIMLTYPLTWRESDRELFQELFRETAKKYILVDQSLIDEIDIELVCSEPVAVAAYLLWESIFQYGLDAMKLMSSTLGNVDGDSHLRILVLDIGGGSTDIAVVQVDWERATGGEIDVRFKMIESMRFNRAGDRITHIIVTALLHYLRSKYGITESLDFEAEPENLAFTISYKRNALSKLNELAEDAKRHLSLNSEPWQLSDIEEKSLLDCFEPLVSDELPSDAENEQFILDRDTFESWIRRDRQSLETNGEAGMMDIFLFLKDLGQNLDDQKRSPHSVILSGRTTRLPIFRKLASEALNMPYHRVRTLRQMLPLTVQRPGHENPDKISVVAGAHRFRFGDNVRFIPLPNEPVFNRYIGSVRETPDGLILNTIYAEPGDSQPLTVELEIYPSTDLRIGNCFRREGIAEVVAVLSNTSSSEIKQVIVDILDDFTVRLNKGEGVTLAEWVPGGADIIADNFIDTGKIDQNPENFILHRVLQTNHETTGYSYEA